MNDIKQKSLNCLKDVKGSGKFVTAKTVPFLFPGLEIDGVGELSYPINDVQAKADTHFVKSVLKVQPVWPKRKDGVWLYAEKTDSSHHYQVWHFYLQDDTTVLLQILDFKANKQALQLSENIKQQSNLYLNNLITKQGCGLYLKKNKMSYTATSAGKDCLADKAGIEYLTYSISFTKNTIVWQQNDFNKEDQPSTAGAYSFIKQEKLSK